VFSADPPGCCPDAEFSASFARLDPVSWSMSLRGDIDMDDGDHIAHLVGWVLLSGAVTRLVVDLGRVSFLGSSGIKALADARAYAAAMGCRLVLARPGPAAHRMLRTAGLLQVFGLPAEPAAALLPAVIPRSPVPP
jgi:anti-sigma B factor antagonist